MVSLRTCSKCQLAKPENVDNFGHQPNGTLRWVCRTCDNQRSRQFSKQNPEHRRKRDKKRERLGGRVKWPLETKQLLYKRQHGICLCCAKPLENTDESEVDHINPVKNRGSNELCNLAVVHARCNREKHGTKIFDYWAWRVKVGHDDEDIGAKLGIKTELMKRGRWTSEVLLEVFLDALRHVATAADH